MGLDMWVYRVTKLSDEGLESIKDVAYDELHNIIDGLNSWEWDEDTEELLAPVKPFLSFVKKPVEQIKLEKAKEVFNIPKEAALGACISGEFYFYVEGNPKPYVFDIHKWTPEQRAKIVETNMLEFALCHIDELLYWRKHYDLQDALHDACELKIENCGFYPLNDKMKKAINDSLRKEGREGEICDLEPTEDSVACYHEWY